MVSRCIPKIYNLSLRSEEVLPLFISGKLPMTEDEGRIFVKYTILAVVHMIRVYIH